MFGKLSSVFAALACLIATPAKAVVIDFETLAAAGSGQSPHGMSYTEKGFNFASSSTDHNFATWQTGSANFFGSTALWNGDGTGVNGITTLTKVGGGAFDLLSIDLAELNLGGGPVTVSFVATFSGGGTTSQSFTLDGSSATNNLSSFQTFNFTGFNDIVSVNWLQTTPYHQFDNVTIQDAAAVPLLGALPLFVSGLGAMGLLGWRRKRKTKPAAA